MRRRQLGELADRVAALEAAARSGRDPRGVEARLDAIEEMLRALAGHDAESAGAKAALRRCARLVAEHVPAGQRLAVASPTEDPSPALEHEPAVSFGGLASDSEPGFEHGLGAVARLEAERAEGSSFLLLPEPPSGWEERLPELAHHLRARYQLVADEEGVGAVFDVGSRSAGEDGERALGKELDRLTDGDAHVPVLDWTGLEVASLVPGRNVFTPIADDGELPHLDGTVEVVVVDSAERLAEARRVASVAVVQVGLREDGGVRVVGIEDVGPAPRRPGAGALVVVVTADPGDRWIALVDEAVREGNEVEVIASAEPEAAAAVAAAEMAVLVEPGVLPLPGCIDALAGTLAAEPDAAACTVKLLDRYGDLAGAGSAIFGDGSAAGIGGGVAPIAAAWHEYVRSVWAAGGVLALRGSVAREVADDPGSLLAASALVWGGGHRLVYQPDATAVRVTATRVNGTRSAPPGIAEWATALPSCPERPVLLDAGAWRNLLAGCDAEDAWR